MCVCRARKTHRGWAAQRWKMGGSYNNLLNAYDFDDLCRVCGDDASTKHLRHVNLSYFEHARHSLGLAWLLAVGAAQAVLHALVPAWYLTGTTDCVRQVGAALEAVKPKTM